MDNIIKCIQEESIGKYIENARLSNYTTYKVGGLARIIVYPTDEKKLIKLLKYLRKEKITYKIIGNGSNLLFSDKDYNGVLVKLDKLDSLHIINNTIRVGAGYNLMLLANLMTKRGLSGLEFATGIPGTVGGAVYMNAGAYNSDMGYIVKKVKVLTANLEVITLSNSEMDFHYRSSMLQKKKDYVCLEATIKLKYGNKQEMINIVKDRKQRRIESQPLEFPSAGSVFRNPKDNFAGKLIEDLGLKGLTKGGAQISPKHANFIVNIGNAKANDIKELIEFVRDSIKENYNIDLKVEQEFVNWE